MRAYTLDGAYCNEFYVRLPLEMAWKFEFVQHIEARLLSEEGYGDLVIPA